MKKKTKLEYKYNHWIGAWVFQIVNKNKMPTYVYIMGTKPQY